jgi:hypothetical protein
MNKFLAQHTPRFSAAAKRQSDIQSAAPGPTPSVESILARGMLFSGE